MIDLGDGRHRALAPAAARALLDGHGRRDTEDRIHIGTRRGLDKLPGVRVKRFEIAALPFRKEDIERQRALAAAANARDDDKFVTGDADVDVLEVVLARVVNAYRIVGPRRVKPGGQL